MNKICSSCGSNLSKIDAPGDPDEAPNGLCRACATHFLADIGVSIEEFLESFDLPVVTVTENAIVAYANSQARKVLGKALQDISGLRGGDVFECEHALLPGGCGQTLHCSGCAIRQTVTDTIKTGNSHKNVPAFLNHHEPTGSRKIDMLISTEKQGGVVFLSIIRMDEGL